MDGICLSKALCGATSGRKEIIDLLRQRSRPYLFPSSLSPSLSSASTELRDRLEAHTRYFKRELSARGFGHNRGDHAIVPIMLCDAVLAKRVAARLLEKGVYTICVFAEVKAEFGF